MNIARMSIDNRSLRDLFCDCADGPVGSVVSLIAVLGVALTRRIQLEGVRFKSVNGRLIGCLPCGSYYLEK